MERFEGVFRMSPAETLHRLAVPGADVEYSDRGTGDPVVLVHAGIYADWFLPVAARPELDAFRVVRVRRAGYTGGSPPASHLTIEDHAAHLAAVLDALGVRQAHVCGHSSSAFIALQLAMDHPAAVAGRVLIEPALGTVLEGPVAAEFARSTVAPAMQAAASGDLERAFDTWMRGVGGAAYAAVLERALGPDGHREALRQSAFFFRDEGPAVREWVFDADRAATIHQPVRLVTGEMTVEPFRAVGDRLAGMLPAAEAVTLPGADHLMPLAQPGGVAEVIAGFAARHPIGRSAAPSGSR
jgi:pimeloyl-ACP methyl ester carboxylesterase